MAKKGKAVKAGMVLARYRSASRPGVKHEVRLGGDETLYCTCEAWRWSRQRPKTCKHLVAFRAQLRTSAA